MRPFRDLRFGFHRAAPLAAALALAGCALNQPPEPEALRADALPTVKVPEAWASPGGGGGRRHRQLARLVRGQAARGARGRGARQQPGPARGRRARRARGRLREAGRLDALSAGEPLARGSFTGSDDRQRLRDRGALRELGARSLGARARRRPGPAPRSTRRRRRTREYARQSIAALVARSWFLAIEARRQRVIAQEMLSAAEKLAVLARERARIGRGDEYDVRLAQASLQGYRDTVLQLQLSEQQAIRAIETLVGRYPAAALDTAPQIPRVPGPGARGPSLGAPRAPPRRRRRGAARGFRVLPGRRGPGGATAAHLAHGEREQHHERPRLPQGSRQPGVERRAATSWRRSSWAARSRRRWKSARPSRRRPSPTTAASARSAFSEVENALSAGFNLAARSRFSRPLSPRTIAPSSSPRCATGRHGRPARGPAAAARRLGRGAVRAHARAERAARPAREPAPGTGRRLRSGPGAGAGKVGGALTRAARRPE